MTHSAGPWTTKIGVLEVGIMTHEILDDNGEIVADISPIHDPAVGKEIVVSKEEFANARLIAAAPELLEALLTVIDQLKQLFKPLKTWPESDMPEEFAMGCLIIYDSALNAINKATGEAIVDSKEGE
jgi:hypothetical protein